ncbi:Sds3-like-domain-containing protein [Lipomyces kononenkoae]|uniref:Sds3-like-domain-containing protein n=1 Tax=Lipomyces kononenkoae TaxID=34357 RepID=A0ACC3T0D8_LIPKO
MDNISEKPPMVTPVEENPEEAETDIEGDLSEEMDIKHPQTTELNEYEMKEDLSGKSIVLEKEDSLSRRSKSSVEATPEAAEPVEEKPRLDENGIEDFGTVVMDEEDDGEISEDDEKEEGEIESTDGARGESPLGDETDQKNEEDEDEEMKDSTKYAEETLDSAAQEDDDEKVEEGEIEGEVEVELVPEVEEGEEVDEAEEGEADADEVRSEKPKRKRTIEEEDDDEERVQKRKAAVTSLTEIEVEFAKLRDRLHDDKIARLQAEIEMCLDGTHPELATVYDELAEGRDKKIQLADAHRKYRRRCIENQTRSYRTHIHQQLYNKHASLRAAMIQETTETWYKVNRERRAMDTLVPFYGYRIPEKRSVIYRQRQAQYNEIALLAGIAKYIGFPAAPEIKSATADEVAEDMEALHGKIMFV